MKLKPRNALKKNIAMLYKRFVNIEKSFNTEVVYNTISDGLFWIFDNQELKFIEISADAITAETRIKEIIDFETILQYQNKYFKYNGNSWVEMSESGSDFSTLDRVVYSNIAKYQTNKYYYVGSFDFMIKGSIEGGENQYIKGNIVPMTSMNIKFYDDNINMTIGSLVVCDGKLYAVESVETDYKYQPKPYAVHYATLTSIL